MLGRRMPQLDLLRSLAIVFVVLRHASETFYWSPLMKESAPLPLQSMAAEVAFFTLGRMGVPLFLMLTGFLLLPREYDGQAISSFVRRRWVPLLICLEAWIALWTLSHVAAGGRAFDPAELFRCELLLGSFDRVNSVWYLHEILGIYLLLPIVARGLFGLIPRDVAAPLGIAVLLFFVLSTIQRVGRALGFVGLATQISAGFTGGSYGVYLLLGWALERGVLKRVGRPALVACLVLSIVAVMGLQVPMFVAGCPYDLWYDNPLLAIGCVALFELVRRSRPGLSGSGAVRSLAKYSFGIYLIHKPVQMFVGPMARNLGLPLPLSALLLLCVLVVSSWAIAAAISRIPVIGKPLLYLR